MFVVRLKGIFEAKGNNRGVSAVSNDEQGEPTAICHFLVVLRMSCETCPSDQSLSATSGIDVLYSYSASTDEPKSALKPSLMVLCLYQQYLLIHLFTGIELQGDYKWSLECGSCWVVSRWRFSKSTFLFWVLHFSWDLRIVSHTSSSTLISPMTLFSELIILLSAHLCLS